MDDEIRETIRGAAELCERFGMDPKNLRRLEGFTGLRLTQDMVDEARAEPEEPPAEPEWEPKRMAVDGIKVRQARVIPAPPNTPGRNAGFNWIPGLKHGDSVYHEQWGRLVFLRYDGGMCVTRHTREHLDPDAPPEYPRMGATPAGAKAWVDPHELWVEDK